MYGTLTRSHKDEEIKAMGNPFGINGKQKTKNRGNA